jgi:hypothetical protein
MVLEWNSINARGNDRESSQELCCHQPSHKKLKSNWKYHKEPAFHSVEHKDLCRVVGMQKAFLCSVFIFLHSAHYMLFLGVYALCTCELSCTPPHIIMLLLSKYMTLCNFTHCILLLNINHGFKHIINYCFKHICCALVSHLVFPLWPLLWHLRIAFTVCSVTLSDIWISTDKGKEKSQRIKNWSGVVQWEMSSGQKIWLTKRADKMLLIWLHFPLLCLQRDTRKWGSLSLVHFVLAIIHIHMHLFPELVAANFLFICELVIKKWLIVNRH